jgi:cell wall-associated NlpC family hydrolase
VESPYRGPSSWIATGLAVIAVGSVVAVAIVATVLSAIRPHHDATAGTTVVVFTVSAPYQPGANNASRPSTPARAAVVPATNAPAPVGNWTSERGVTIAQRALSWLGWPYSFAAGNGTGPTYGQAVDQDSRNDWRVKGFDCSGLVMYALAPWLQLTHFAATQYSEAGSVHPSLDALQPGDLVFWSHDGTVNDIGHVAIYVGNGNVVEAPHSGAYIQVVPLDQVEAGRIGTTRPLT